MISYIMAHDKLRALFVKCESPEDFAWVTGVMNFQYTIRAAGASHSATEPLYARLVALTTVKLAEELK